MTDWAEHAPEELGVDPARLSRALELVGARGGAAQLCVLREGRVLLDRAIGCRPDALFCLFSAGEPPRRTRLTALLRENMADL